MEEDRDLNDWVDLATPEVEESVIPAYIPQVVKIVELPVEEVEEPHVEVTGVAPVPEWFRLDREILLRRLLTLSIDSTEPSVWYHNLRLTQLLTDGTFELQLASLTITRDYIKYSGGIVYFGDVLMSGVKIEMAAESGLELDPVAATDALNMAATIMQLLAVPTMS